MFIKYNSIDNPKNKIHDLRKKYGMDLPTVQAFATEKVHGTNAAVSYYIKDGEGVFAVQKRTAPCTPEDDNAQCAKYAYEREEQWVHIIKEIADKNEVDLAQEAIILYYEWAGGNIQQKTCVTGLEKMSFIFRHAKAITRDEAQTERWIDTLGKDCTDHQIYNIVNFPTWEFDLDLNQPQLEYDRLSLLVSELEDNSPLGNCFHMPDNIMEGIVVEFFIEGELHKFKVKGEKHSTTPKKVPKSNPFDDDTMKMIHDLSHELTPSWRLSQGVKEVGDLAENIGDLIKWVCADIEKEEQADLEKLEDGQKKRLMGLVSKICAMYIKNNIDNMDELVKIKEEKE